MAVEMADAASSISFPPISFTMPSMASHNFTAGTERFNPSGMAGIFFAANKTLDFLFPKYDQFLKYELDRDNLLNVSHLNPFEVAMENKGPLGFIIGFVLLATIITISGVFWCLAKCCCGGGKCCSRRSEEEVQASKILTKHDKCKRTVCSVLFAALVIAFTFGLVCCFVTNEMMKKNVQKLPKHADNAFEDVETYLRISQGQVSTLLDDNYQLLESNIKKVLEDAGPIIQDGLSRQTGAQALTNLTDVMDAVENVKNSLSSVNKASGNIKGLFRRLQRALKDSRDRLLKSLDNCDIPKCEELKNSDAITELKVEEKFKELPDVSTILQDLEDFFGKDVKASIDKGQQQFNSLSVQIQNEVNPFIPKVISKLEATGKELRSVARDWNSTLEEIRREVGSARVQLNDKEEVVRQYVPYWYYVMLGICGALTFIFMLLTLGIFIGFCGKQPGSEYSDECCSRKTGSTFINCGIFFIFLTYLVFTIVALGHFIMGGAGSQVICEAMYNLDVRAEDFAALPPPKLSSLAKNRRYQMPKYSDVLRMCQRGASAYEAFRLEQMYDVNKVENIAKNISGEAQKLAQKVQVPNDSTRDIQFLSPEVQGQIDKFADSKITKMNFDAFIDQLGESAHTVDLTEVIHRLQTLVNDSQAAAIATELKDDLENEIMVLKSLQDTVVVPMVKSVNQSISHLRSVAVEQKDLVARLKSVVGAAQKAQDQLRAGVTELIRMLSVDYAASLEQYIGEYGRFTAQEIKTSLGECRPLYNAYNSTVSSVCHNVLNPVSGFWLAISCLLLLFVPLLITGCSLSQVYKKFKVGGYESVNSYVNSATYYPSSYGDGDTIPLSLNPHSRRKRENRGLRPSSETSRYSHRFEDAAHKAWNSQQVYNSHHTPPTSGEYERPPPYYYPGPAQ